MKKHLSKKLIVIALVITMVLLVFPATVLAEDNFPTATVNKLDAKTGVDLYVPVKSVNYEEYKIGTVDTEVLYEFIADDEEADLENNEYADWYCDYVVSFNSDIPKESMGLYGSYGDYLNIAFLMPYDIPADYKIYLLKELGLDSQLTYTEVVTLVEKFICGAFNLATENLGKKMTVALTIFQKNDMGEPINQHVVNEYVYTMLKTTKVKTTVDINDKEVNVEFSYGGVGLHEDGWVLPFDSENPIAGKYFLPQTESDTYFLTDAFNDITEKPVEKVDSEIAVKDTNSQEITDDAAKKAAEEVVNQIKANTNVHDESSDIQKKIDGSVVDNLITKASKLTIDLTELSIEVETQMEVTTVTTTYSATYNVEPHITTVTNGVVETRIITNEELAEHNTVINFKLPVPSTMTGNTVRVVHTLHTDSGDTTESWTAKVEGSGDNRYVSISATAFSDYELSQVTETNAVAKIENGGQTYYYTDIASAINDAQDGDTVVLLADIDGTVVVDKAIKVSENGHTISGITNGSRCTMSKSDSVYTFTYKTFNVTVTSRSTVSEAAVSAVSGGGQYVFNDTVTVVASKVSGYDFLGWFSGAYNDEATPVSAEYSYSFDNANADTALVAVYKPIDGQTFTIKVNGTSYGLKIGNGEMRAQTGLALVDVTAGTVVTIKYTGEDGFMYWVNPSDNIVSESVDYSFTVVGYTEVRAISHGEVEDAHSAFVVFHNASKQVLSASRWYDDETVQFPVIIPGKMGYRFTRWIIRDTATDTTPDIEATDESIREAMETKDVIHIDPEYEKLAGYYFLNIYVYDKQKDTTTQVKPSALYVKNIGFSMYDDYTVQIDSGEAFAVSLSSLAAWSGLNKSDIEAQFSYWAIGNTDTPYSYKSSSYSVQYATSGKTVALYFVKNAGTNTLIPACNVSEMFAVKVDNETYLLSTVAKISAPLGVTVNETGFVYGKKSAVFGAEKGSDKLIVGGDYVTQVVTSKPSSEQVYTFNLETGYSYNRLFIKAYMVYTDSEGIHTVYSDMVSGSYDSLNK